jgi:hypothetical protein
MVLMANFVQTFAFKMVSTNPVQFLKSNPPPSPAEPDQVEDDFDGSSMLAKGAKYIGKGTTKLKASGNAIDWDNQEPVDDNWADIGQGLMTFMPEIGVNGVFLALGSTPGGIKNAGYWTSGPSGSGWSEHVFPEDFSSQSVNDWVDWLVGNGDSADPVLVIGLNSNGRIYRSVDAVNWSLRFDPFPEQTVNSIAWNPMANNGAGAFFAVMLGSPGNPNNLLTSPDGVFWNPVDPNDLPSSTFSLACDTGKNLMIARSSSSAFEPEFRNGGYWMSDDDGETWKEFADRRGGFVTFLPLKIGPVIDDTVFIDTGDIVISDTRSNPDTAIVSLLINAFNSSDANLIKRFTSRDSTAGLGLWAGLVPQFERLADTLNPFYYQIRLDGAGDAFRAFSEPINEWTDFDTTVSWGYLLDSGPDSKSFTGTLRIRDKDTLVESNTVSVQIDCAVIKGADLSGVESVTAVGTVGFIPHGEAAILGVESPVQISSIGVNVVIALTGVEATPAVGTVTAT